MKNSFPYQERKRYLYSQSEVLNIAANYRVLENKMIFVRGLPAQLMNQKLLAEKEFFGQYGKIKSIAISKLKFPNSNQKRTVNITFSKISEASTALICTNNLTINHTRLKVSFGTSKYCIHYLSGFKCKHKRCPYAHKTPKDGTHFVWCRPRNCNYFKIIGKRETINFLVSWGY